MKSGKVVDALSGGAVAHDVDVLERIGPNCMDFVGDRTRRGFFACVQSTHDNVLSCHICPHWDLVKFTAPHFVPCTHVLEFFFD